MMNKERKEIFMRILIGIVSGIILELWAYVVIVLAIFHWFYVLFTGKRHKEIAKFCNLWVSQSYKYFRYMTFATNHRLFPFTDLGKEIEPIDL